MFDKVNYSIVSGDNGNISVQSTVKSFNLDHVTAKDITSFYTNFSQYAASDTGLLPVDGSGILSIRTAGQFTQFAYQHKPGLYHINWAVREGDRYASAYYLAQPYRIIICDMQDGNLLGARTFYSPYPITSPTQQLYHVNLPNINCRGYRGNGVGWICLYQNEDWSELPLNERIVRFIERCSGVETYNDENMSETDGTRFYKSNNKPEYTWDPIEWQKKSEEEGFAWTLDESLWIPVLVKDMDHQGQHDPNGVPLTFADALVGDYKAYYYDEVTTKPINAIIRPDKTLDEATALSYFVKSYNNATTKPNALLNDTFNQAVKIKDSKSSSVLLSSLLENTVTSHSNSDQDDDEDEETFYCTNCESTHHVDKYGFTDGNLNAICADCQSDSYVHVKNANAYIHADDENLIYSQHQSKFFHLKYDTVYSCPSCDFLYATDSVDEVEILKVKHSIFVIDGESFCHECISESGIEVISCAGNCSTSIPFGVNSNDDSVTVKASVPSLNENGNISVDVKDKTFCAACSKQNFICPCGLIKQNTDEDFNPCNKSVLISEVGISYEVTQACASCVQFNFDPNNSSIVTAEFKPFNLDVSTVYLNSKPDTHNSMIKGLEVISEEDAF